MTIDNPIRIKADLNGDLRRFTLNSCSIQELCATIRQIYAQVNASHYISVRYLDDEGDYVSMSTDEELKEAVNLANSEILRIQVRLEVHPLVASQPPSVESSTYPVPLSESFSREVPVATHFPAMPVPSAPAVFSGNIYPVLNEEPPAACCSAPPVAPASPVVAPYGDKREFKMQMKQQKQEFKRQLREMKRSCHQDNVQQCRQLKAEVRATKQKLKEQSRELKQQYRQQKQQQRGHMGGEPHLMARFVREFFASPSVPMDSENQPQPGMLIAQPGEPFTWFWRFRNDGPVAWPCQNGGNGSICEGEPNPFNVVGGVQLVPVGRWAEHANFQSPAGGLALPMSSVAPGEVVDVALPLRAPALPGLYRAYWRLATHSGKKFGPRVQVNVLVVANRAEAAAALGGGFAPLQRSGPANLDSSSDEDEDCSSSDDEKCGQVDFVAYLQQLNDMGFGNQKKNMKLLLKHNGNLEAVVACLLKKKDKKAKKQAKKQHC